MTFSLIVPAPILPSKPPPAWKFGPPEDTSEEGFHLGTEHIVARRSKHATTRRITLKIESTLFQ